jgi:hypothetical protein
VLFIQTKKTILKEEQKREREREEKEWQNERN